MFEWLSSYNYDFALASIPIQCVFLVYYGIRRTLPVRQNTIFLTVMVSNLVMTLADIVSCECNEIWTQYPLWFMYGLNQVYFLAFIVRGWALFDYTAEACRFYQPSRRSPLRSRVAMAVPALALMALILSTSWTGAIFTFTETGYHNCTLYSLIYVSTYFYIFSSFLCIALSWGTLTRRVRLSSLAFNIVLLLGILFRKLFFHVLVTSYFSILTILIIFLSSQNPDLYRDMETTLFNRAAFDLICADYLSKNIPFHCVIATVQNYESAQLIYGPRQMRRGLKQIGDWLIENLPGYYVFYFRHGNYLLFQRKKRPDNDRDQIAREIRERFAHSGKSAGAEIAMPLSTLVVPNRLIPGDSSQVVSLIRYLFPLAQSENQRGVYTASEEHLTALHRRAEVESALGRALAEHRMEAWLQPIYSTAEERIVGAEALARLHDPELGYISPVEFIPVAELSGHILELGRQIFQQACAAIQRYHLRERGIGFVNVNLSPAQCMNEQLAAELSGIAAAQDVPMGLFDFEITETFIDDTQRIRLQMLRLQETGAELSLDDFGTGTSNLTRLMALPIHVVKIDMSIVTSYFRHETNLLPNLVRMFQDAEMKIVAEGVETKEIKDALTAMGCDYLQGYYFSRPVPPAEFAALLEREEEKTKQSGEEAE